VVIALYTPGCGYYANPTKKRIGRSDDTDFYTATSIGSIFTECVAAAARSLMGDTFCQSATFVEIGAENQQTTTVPSGFLNHRRSGCNEPIHLEGKCVVFSNELFDAQPFDRLVFSNGSWKRCGVEVVENTLHPCILPDCLQNLQPLPDGLPTSAEEGYVLDVPSGAERLLKQIFADSWEGLFIAFDYGKDWKDITRHFPEGTARCYSKHRQNNQLFSNPGEQDITHDVCWDRMEVLLKTAGCNQVQTLRQETFLVRYAMDVITPALANTDDFYTRRKLMELLHPGHLGAKFQVLTGIR